MLMEYTDQSGQKLTNNLGCEHIGQNIHKNFLEGRNEEKKQKERRCQDGTETKEEKIKKKDETIKRLS